MQDLKLNYKRTIYIGLAFFLITMFWQTYDGIIAKVLIDKFGMSQATSGVVMAIDNILAIFMLPLFGLLSDKTRSKLGKRTPFILIGTLIAAVAFVSLSFVDHKQTLVVQEAGIVEEYNRMYDEINRKDGMTKAEWNLVFYDEDFKYPELTKKYEVIASKYADSDIINKFDQRDISDIYYNSLSNRAWEETRKDSKNLVMFIVLLFIVLVAMSLFRSPAVALMPDVTLKPLRSKANAIINLLGSAGAVVSIGILTVFGLSKKSYVEYTPAFIATSIVMLVALLIFMLKVKENKFRDEYQELSVKYGLEEKEDEEHTEKKVLTKAEKTSMLLILMSVFFWYMGYNAVISKLSDYAPKQLNMDFALPLLVAQGAAIVSFIPIGILSSKFGRKKMILFGVALLAICFGSASFLTAHTGGILYIILALTGVAWATINVNSFPMAVELATGKDVGRFTGYYYAFSMAAQIITPIISGLLMDKMQRSVLFPYAAFFVVLSFITMIFVKHGDVKIAKKGLLESFDVED
ncbi:MFS transporter [Haploplasma axanthum]|uniref:Putative symporter YagG n=1 Tax=Haploplasma axanthum TaxID=29552 RepID=A0A449BE26_HAPAX|nr:MFS transporter [Haploplasma axanthum]VEU80560.1 putative symporter YagG [Haploplasma axanthum]